MNCNELMIGDWVYVTSVCGWECEPIQQQIRGIEFSSFKGDDYCDWVSVDCDDEASLYHINPITLTAEILEKNGWMKCGQPYEWKEGIFVQRWNHTNSEIIFEILETPNFDGFTWKGIKINDVHILQHTLRLCGLNDLADNFNI